MDQSKWAVPRQRVAQSSKETAGLVRPRMKLHGIWMHGVSLNIFVCHPGLSADSSLITETLCRVLESTALEFQKRNKEMPQEILVWDSWLWAYGLTFNSQLKVHLLSECNAEIPPSRLIIVYARTKTILDWSIWGVLSASRWPTLLEYFSARWATHMGFWVARMQYDGLQSWTILISPLLGFMFHHYISNLRSVIWPSGHFLPLQH